MYDLISRQQVLDGLDSFRPVKPESPESVMETVNRSAWDCALNCAESFVNSMPPATICGYNSAELWQTALLLREADITPEELHDIAGNMQATFDLIYDLLQKEHQKALAKALSHWMKPEA